MKLSGLNRPERANASRFPIRLPDVPGKLGVPVRVCSYNVRIDHVLDQEGTHNWPARKDMIIRILQRYCPTVIGFQEANEAQYEFLCSSLPDYRFVDYAARPDTEESEHLPIAFLSHEFECEQHGCFWLSATPDTPSVGWDGRYARICSWVQLRSMRQPSNLWVLNTHLDHKGTQAREEGVKVIREHVTKLTGDDAVLFMGDLNLFPDFRGEEVYQLILEGGKALQDVRDQTDQHFGPDGTWIGWEYDPHPSPADKVGNRLDHIFTAGPCHVLQEGVLNLNVDVHQQIHEPYPQALLKERLYPSDHLPVLADLAIK